MILLPKLLKNRVGKQSKGVSGLVYTNIGLDALFFSLFLLNRNQRQLFMVFQEPLMGANTQNYVNRFISRV